MRKIIIFISVILLPVAAFAQDTTLTVTSEGNVGIGITNPSHKLVVNGNVQIGDIHTAYRSIEIDAAIPLANYNGTTSFIASTVPGSGIAKYAFHFKTNTRGAGTTQADLLVDGKVGIGTTNPEVKLHVVDGTIKAEGRTKVLELNYVGSGGFIYQSLQRNGVDKWWLVSNTFDKLEFRGSPGVDNVTALTLTQDGKVGIGTTNPLAKLHVSGVGMTIDSFIHGADPNESGGYWMKEKATSTANVINFANQGGSVKDVSIYASGSIVADGKGVFVAATVNWSDERTKKVIGKSDSKVDLDILNQIEITDYVKIKEGNREKKVVAQQLRQVFPQAVSFMRGVVPTIFEMTHDCSYEKATELLTVTVKKEHELAVGDEVDIYTDQKNLIQVKVQAVPSPHTFIVTADHEPNRVFVYGKWVDDVHMVDYDAVSMLNVSATQELAKRVEALEIENAQLKTQNLALAKQGAAINVLQDKIAQLEVILQKMTAMTRVNSHTTASATMPANAKRQMSLLKNETGE